MRSLDQDLLSKISIESEKEYYMEVYLHVALYTSHAASDEYGPSTVRMSCVSRQFCDLISMSTVLVCSAWSTACICVEDASITHSCVICYDFLSSLYFSMLIHMDSRPAACVLYSVYFDTWPIRYSIHSSYSKYRLYYAFWTLYNSLPLVCCMTLALSPGIAFPKWSAVPSKYMPYSCPPRSRHANPRLESTHSGSAWPLSYP